MKKYISSISRLSLLVLVLLLYSGININAQEEIPFEGGKWQSIIDGQSGEGAFFYRFYFEETGDVNVVK